MNVKSLIVMVTAGIIVGLYESTAMTFLNPPLIYFQPAILFLILLIITDRTKGAYTFALGVGMTHDFYSLEGSQYILVELLLLVFFLRLIALRVLTNQSLYSSLALSFMARFFDLVWRMVGQSLRNLFEPEFSREITGIFGFWPIFLFDAVLLCLIFFFGKYILKRFLALRSFFKTSKPYA